MAYHTLFSHFAIPITDFQPPTFNEVLDDIAVEEGDNATFEVKVAGIPLPEVRW